MLVLVVRSCPPRSLLLAFPLASLALLSGCGSADDVGGCWLAENDARSVYVFVDTDDEVVLGQEVVGKDDETRTVEYRGTWQQTGETSYRLDARCEGVDGRDGGCEGIRGWSMQCSLVGEERLDCVGSPFASETRLGVCPTGEDEAI